MKRLVDLPSPFDRLHQPKENGQNQDKYRNPECIPLHSVPPIMSPLPDGIRSSLIKNLFQNNQTIAPEAQVFESPLVGCQLPNLDEVRVETAH
jgi:hypothetical protein